jgi:ribosome-binding ATPase YchF (GTP1/OBG family)
VIRAAFELLELISFFTAGEGKEAKAYAIHRGTTAQGAAGDIHTDIQKGFVRAEILPWSTLVEQGGYAGAREKGLLRIEGRDYAIQDGDVMTVRFTP